MTSHKEFWIEAKGKVKRFADLDDANLVFGAHTRGHGHGYKVSQVFSATVMRA